MTRSIERGLDLRRGRDSKLTAKSTFSPTENGRKPDKTSARAPIEVSAQSTELGANSTREPQPGDPDSALARALDAAAAAGRFDVVAQLADELKARRLATLGNVIEIASKRGRSS